TIRLEVFRQGLRIQRTSNLHTAEYGCPLRPHSTFRESRRGTARRAASDIDRGGHEKIAPQEESIYRLEPELGFQDHCRRLFASREDRQAVCVHAGWLG